MSEATVSALREVRSLGPELNRLDDLISDSIQSVEVAMRSHLSVRIKVGVDPSGEYVAFGKQGGKWQLLWCSSDGNEIPLLSAPREVRAQMLSMGHIENLIRSASAQLSSAIEQRKSALASAAALLKVLGSV